MISRANLVTNSSTTDAASYNTASISPGANKLILATVVSRTGITADPNQPTLSGNGLTWVAIASVVFDNTSSSRRRVTLFRAMGASPSTGAVTIDFGGQTQTACDWNIEEVSGMDTSGTNGSGAIVQSATNFDNATGTPVSTLTVTLSAFSNTNNATFGAFGYGGTGTSTAGSGFTKLGDVMDGETSIRLTTEFRSDNDTSVDISYSAAGEIGGIAIEIKAAGTAYSQTCNETVTIVDTVTKTAGKVLNDVVTIVDTRTRIISRSLGEVVTIVDTVTKTATRIFNEVLSIVDTFTYIRGKNLNETATIVDTATKSTSRSLGETVTIVDTVTAVFSKILNETITVIDTITRTITKSFSEVMTIVDSVSYITGKVYTETVTIIDSISQSKVFYRMLDEVINLTDTISFVFNSITGGILRLFKDGLRSSGKPPLEASASSKDKPPAGSVRAKDKPEAGV